MKRLVGRMPERIDVMLAAWSASAASNFRELTRREERNQDEDVRITISAFLDSSIKRS